MQFWQIKVMDSTAASSRILTLQTASRWSASADTLRNGMGKQEVSRRLRCMGYAGHKLKSLELVRPVTATVTVNKMTEQELKEIEARHRKRQEFF